MNLTIFGLIVTGVALIMWPGFWPEIVGGWWQLNKARRGKETKPKVLPWKEQGQTTRVSFFLFTGMMAMGALLTSIGLLIQLVNL